MPNAIIHFPVPPPPRSWNPQPDRVGHGHLECLGKRQKKTTTVRFTGGACRKGGQVEVVMDTQYIRCTYHNGENGLLIVGIRFLQETARQVLERASLRHVHFEQGPPSSALDSIQGYNLTEEPNLLACQPSSRLRCIITSNTGKTNSIG